MADKNFKVKTGLSLPSPLSVDQGGTGQTTAGNALNALLPLQTGNINYYLQTNGTTTQWNAISGLKPEANSAISTNQTLVSGYRYFVDTSAPRTLTLPAYPSVGDEIQIFDATGNAVTNNISILRNSLKINGQSDDAIIDIGGGNSFIYTGPTIGWRFI